MAKTIVYRSHEHDATIAEIERFIEAEERVNRDWVAKGLRSLSDHIQGARNVVRYLKGGYIPGEGFIDMNSNEKYKFIDKE